MNKLPLTLLVFLTTTCNALFAQDTLPKFSVKNVGNNRIIISWTNNFQSIRQISIQRSFDSLSKFKTILTVPDATTPQNGYVDTKATNDHMFYRIYILLEHGVYFFSETKKPVPDTSRKSEVVDNVINVPAIGIVTENKIPGFVPSKHVYTYKDGYVRISLPEDENKKYSIKFFEDDDAFLFELKDLKERSFKIDKTNFYHAGWFKFELYESGKLVEKHKFYLEKEF